MSTTYGVAKQANAISVRVLNSAGFGSIAYVASHYFITYSCMNVLMVEESSELLFSLFF